MDAQYHTYLVGGTNPSEKYEFVSWDDSKYMEKNNLIHVPVTSNQLLNMGKPPFSSGFPMVFLWFSWELAADTQLYISSSPSHGAGEGAATSSGVFLGMKH